MEHLKAKHLSEIPGTSRESDALKTSNSRVSHGKRKKIDELCSSSTDNQKNSFHEVLLKLSRMCLLTRKVARNTRE